MNKFKIIIGALALVLVAVVIIACSKDKETKAYQGGDKVITVSKENDMNAYLKQFKKKMQTDSKGDEALTMEDARWHLEAVLNYTYGDAGYEFSDIQNDTFYYKIPTHEEGITLGRLNEAFNAFSNKVEKSYEECTLPEKRILAIQTKFNTESKNGGVSAQIILSTGGGVVPQYLWFDTMDYWNEWYYDFGSGYIIAGGKCGPYEGECPESGAPHELTIKLNSRIPGHACPGTSGYYTDLERIILSYESYYSSYFDDFVYDENSPCHFKLYYRNEDPHEPWASNPGGCICPEDMNYYLSKGPELFAHYKPIGKVFIGGYYQSNDYVGSFRDENCFHELILDYGVFHCGGPETID